MRLAAVIAFPQERCLRKTAALRIPEIRHPSARRRGSSL